VPFRPLELMVMKMTTTARVRSFLLPVFLSGMAALIYQTLWIRELSLVVGAEVYAVTIGVAAFFMGLALGSLWFGKLSERVTRPLYLLVCLEGVTAVSGIFTTISLLHSAPIFVQLQDQVGFPAWLLPFILTGVPALCMGGTLPVLLRVLSPDQQNIGRNSGIMYAVNTSGAITGTLLAVFFLIHNFGVIGTSLAAALLNLGALLLVLVSSVKIGSGRQQQDASLFLHPSRPGLFLYTLAGGVAMGYEVIWSEIIVQFLSTRTFAFAVMLATYLLGLALGAALYALFADRIKNPWLGFGLLIAGAGISSLLLFSVLGDWIGHWQYGATEIVIKVTRNLLALMCARFAVPPLVLILLPTMFLGAAFPAAVRVIARSGKIGADFGMVAAWNTLGGVGGTLLTGFVLIPTFGLTRSLVILALTATLVGSAAIVYQQKKLHSYALATALILAIIIPALGTPPDKPGKMLARDRGGKLLYYNESTAGTVAVLKQQAASHTFRRLYIQGVSNSGDTLPSQRYMRLQGLLPLLIHNTRPDSALVIGFGTGITAGSLLAWPLERRECVELIPAVLQAGHLFHGNLNASEDPRLTIHPGDGRHFLLRTRQQYDLITLEPPPPSARGVANLYSTNFYQLASRRLTQNGMLAQWWPLATQNREDSRSMMRALLDVFPYISVWTTDVYEMMVIGSMQPQNIDVRKLGQRFAMPEVQKTLAEVGVANPEALLATYVMGRTGLAHFAGSAAPVTDNRPSIEYSPWLRRGEISRILPELLRLAEPAPLVHGNPQLIKSVGRYRDELYTFYSLVLSGLGGGRRNWQANISRLRKIEANNPYFHWFFGAKE